MTDWPIQFEHPTRLLGLLIIVPAVWLGLRSLSGLGPWRQRVAILLRAIVLALLVILLADPLYKRKLNNLSVIAIVDRSQSVPSPLQQQSLDYINTVAKSKPAEDRLGVVYAGEVALIHSLPNQAFVPVAGTPPFSGDRTNLEGAVRIAQAVLPGDTAKRILLLSDGNENIGDLRSAARIARANDIPIDIVSLNYDHEDEVIFERLVVPQNTRTGQTISAKCVLRSTRGAKGRLVLEDNGEVIDLDPASPAMSMPVTLDRGLNVTTILLPIRASGIHRFQASFTPDKPGEDTVPANNTGVGVTFVYGKGRIMVVDADGVSGRELTTILRAAQVETEYRPADQFPAELVNLMEYDAVILANPPNSVFSLSQQEMMTRYVHDLGGGLIMVGGPDAFGAGGWIGSPVETALPVDLDPPQKQQMPKGALVLIMHSVEMPNGNYWGEQVAIAAVKALSRLDLVGVIDYDFQRGNDWVYPLSPVGDKTAVISAIEKMQMGDMPDFNSGLQASLKALTECDAGQRHIIIISDGDPSPPTNDFLRRLKNANITVTGVAVFPHDPSNMQSLIMIAQATGGRFYHVTDPNKLPQIFIKETQVVRRPLIYEKTFAPKIIDPLSELTKGIQLTPPKLDGYVLTARKKELVENVIVSPEDDPILACRQYGLGRTVAFTSDTTSRWAKNWLTWSRFNQFWEQVVRWSMRSGESPNFQITSDVDGQRASIVVEAANPDSGFSNFIDFSGAAITPDLKSFPLRLQQIGPGRYQTDFNVNQSGVYVVNLQYTNGNKKGSVRGALAVPFAPEYHELKNNSPLLAEVAQISGGRVLTGDPHYDKLFDRNSLVLPFARHPLWKELSILWLLIFLCDVAVRRVVLDFQTLAAKIRQFLAKFRGQTTSETAVDTLKQHQLEVRKKLKKTVDSAVAQTRFEPTTATPPPPVAPAESRSEKTSTPPPTQPKPTDQPAPPSYLDRLKQAKNKAQERIKDDNKPSDEEK